MTGVLIALNILIILQPMPSRRMGGIHAWLDSIQTLLVIDVALVAIAGLLAIRLALVCRLDWKWILVVAPLAFVPCVNLMVFYGLSVVASNILMAHSGVRIGILGAWKRDFDQLKEVVCRKCGYDTRGLVGEVCPECGTKLDVRRALASG